MICKEVVRSLIVATGCVLNVCSLTRERFPFFEIPVNPFALKNLSPMYITRTILSSVVTVQPPEIRQGDRPMNFYLSTDLEYLE